MWQKCHGLKKIKLTVALESFDLVDDMYLQTNCYWSTDQQESIEFLILNVVDFDHFDYPIGPTFFPVVKWHLKSLKKFYQMWIKTVKLPWFPGVVDFDFRKYIGFEVWSIFESNGLLFCESLELKKSFESVFYLWLNCIFSFQESLDSWLSFFTFPNGLDCPCL